MGLAYNTYLNSNRVYGCKGCKAHLANHDDIVSRVRTHPVLLPLHLLLSLPSGQPLQPLRTHHPPPHPNNQAKNPKLTPPPPFGGGEPQNFRGQHGKAYLFNSVVNIETGDPSERNMTTGRHVVRDIACRVCSEVVGWKYDKAYETSEKYKEGKFILEAELLCTVN